MSSYYNNWGGYRDYRGASTISGSTVSSDVYSKSDSFVLDENFKVWQIIDSIKEKVFEGNKNINVVPSINASQGRMGGFFIDCNIGLKIERISLVVQSGVFTIYDIPGSSKVLYSGALPGAEVYLLKWYLSL